MRALNLLIGAGLLISCQQQISQEQFDQLADNYFERKGVDLLDENLTKLVDRRQNEGRIKEQDSILEAYRVRSPEFSRKDMVIQGVKEAPLQVVLFGHFQDPHTRSVYQLFQALMEKDYSQNLSLGFRHYVSDKFEHSFAAAAAGEAAHKQGKFWEMAELLFENQDNLKDGNLINFAKKLNLDIDRFNADRKSQEVRSQIEADKAYIQSEGSAVTPTIAVNGAIFFGARKERRMRYILDTLLKVQNGEIEVLERY